MSLRNCCQASLYSSIQGVNWVTQQAAEVLRGKLSLLLHSEWVVVTNWERNYQERWSAEEKQRHSDYLSLTHQLVIPNAVCATTATKMYCDAGGCSVKVKCFPSPFQWIHSVAKIHKQGKTARYSTQYAVLYKTHGWMEGNGVSAHLPQAVDRCRRRWQLQCMNNFHPNCCEEQQSCRTTVLVLYQRGFLCIRSQP